MTIKPVAILAIEKQGEALLIYRRYYPIASGRFAALSSISVPSGIGRLLPDADALTAESLEPMDGLGLKFVLLKVGPTLHRSRF